MPKLEILIKENKRSFRPGDEIAGEAVWELEHDAGAIHVRLIWFTSGKGTPDAEQIAAIDISHPTRRERRPFRFTLPSSPYTFSGQLISLHWAIELEADGGAVDVTREEFVLSPTGKEIVLRDAESELKSKRKAGRAH